MSPKRVKVTAAELRAETGKLSGDMRRGERIVGKSTRRMQRDMGRVESGVSRMGGGARARGQRGGRLSGAMGSAGRMLKGAAVMGGVYGIGAEIKKAKQFEEVLVDIAVRGSKNKQWMDRLRGSMLEISNSYGIGKDQLAAYIGTIVDQTGNTELATSTLKSMTAVAYSANVPMKELAGTVVEMQSKLALAPEEFETALGVLAAQADKGKVPLNQMSTILPEILNASVQFGHKGVGALRDYGAMLQMAARGAGTLAEANTSMNRMLDQTVSKRGSIEKTLGIKLKKNGAWLQLGPMMKEIVAGLIKFKAQGKDVEKYIISTWGIRGKKAILPMLQQGMAGWGNRVGAKGGKGGLTSFDALRAAGGAGTIADRVKRKRALSPELDAWNKSVERLKNKLHMHLLPAIKKLGDVLPQISSALTWMIDNWKLLLAVWASGKMLKFFNMASMGATGVGGIISRGASMLGVGGGAAGAGATGGAGAISGAAGFLPALSTASVALGAFAMSLAPAAAGLYEIAKAYDKKEQKKLRDKLVKESRLTNTSFLGGAAASVRKTLEAEGLANPLGVEAGGKQTWKQRREIETRKALGVGRSKSKNLAKIVELSMGGEYAKAKAMTGYGDTGATIKQLRGKSEYELNQIGLSKEMLRVLAALLSQQQSGGNLTGKDMEKFIQAFAQRPVVIVDPNKTASGVTDSRRGKKKK